MASDWQSRLAEMKVICAWCLREGKPGYLDERQPLDNPSPTHGICSRHQEQLLQSLPSSSFPDAEMLIVVHQKDTALYKHLERAFAGVKGVKVIMERRRPEQRPVADERRIRQGTAFSLGYTVVRFKPKGTRRTIRPPGGGETDRLEL